MEFQVKVIAGPDEGKTVRVDEKQLLIGRSDAAGLRLSDESVSWEHATVQVTDGKLFIENLSALGTRLRGQRLAARTRLGYQDEIELSSRCRVRVEAAGEGRKKGVSLLTVLLGALVLLVGAGVVAFLVLRAGEPVAVAVTDANWSSAARQLDERVEQWVKGGAAPAELLTSFRDAVRLERAGDVTAASARWEAIKRALLTLPTPDAVNGHPTMAENYSGTGAALSVLMGLGDPQAASQDRWRSDRAFADALVRYVYRRADKTRAPKEL